MDTSGTHFHNSCSHLDTFGISVAGVPPMFRLRPSEAFTLPWPLPERTRYCHHAKNVFSENSEKTSYPVLPLLFIPALRHGTLASTSSTIRYKGRIPLQPIKEQSSFGRCNAPKPSSTMFHSVLLSFLDFSVKLPIMYSLHHCVFIYNLNPTIRKLRLSRLS